MVVMIKIVEIGFMGRLKTIGLKKMLLIGCLISHRSHLMNWISVKDRLPDKPGRYMIFELITKPFHAHNCLAYSYPYACCEPNIAYFNEYRKGWYFHSDSDMILTPTHWLPLPEPPSDV